MEILDKNPSFNTGEVPDYFTSKQWAAIQSAGREFRDGMDGLEWGRKFQLGSKEIPTPTIEVTSDNIDDREVKTVYFHWMFDGFEFRLTGPDEVVQLTRAFVDAALAASHQLSLAGFVEIGRAHV